MNFPPYKSSNGHTVELYGRLWFKVSSASRKGLCHYPDLEGFEHWKTVCTCEAWKYGERPCRHIAASLEALAEWAEVPGEHRSEWIDRLMFLLNMGHTFSEALDSPSLAQFRPQPKPEPPKVRNYVLRIDKPNRFAKRKE